MKVIIITKGRIPKKITPPAPFFNTLMLFPGRTCGGLRNTPLQLNKNNERCGGRSWFLILEGDKSLRSSQDLPRALRGEHLSSRHTSQKKISSTIKTTSETEECFIKSEARIFLNYSEMISNFYLGEESNTNTTHKLREELTK